MYQQPLRQYQQYTYNFRDNIDVIVKQPLRRELYNIFISEVIELNKDFNYSLYLIGSYVGYLINKDQYNDIDFLITSEKILELNELTNFFKKFHDLCKKHNVAYNIMYSTDKTAEDFSKDLYSGHIFETGVSKIIRLYKRIDIDGKPGLELKPLIGTELYEGLLPKSSGKLNERMRMGVKYYYPIKIQ